MIKLLFIIILPLW